jgi:Ribbon-helix-helix protein, copG family
VTYGSMYGMRKTTVYLPDDLKAALERTAAVRQMSEAELVREAIRRLVSEVPPRRPRVPLFRSRREPIAHRIDEILAEGFGQD